MGGGEPALDAKTQRDRVPGEEPCCQGDPEEMPVPGFETVFVYDVAFQWRELTGKPCVLAIGDGMRTDIIGAARAGLDVLFVTGGIHRSLHKETLDSPADPIELQRLYDENAVWPVAAIPVLRP